MGRFRQLPAQEELEEKDKRELQETPESSECCRADPLINVHANKDGDHKVGVESVADEERSEDRPPREIHVPVALQREQHCEDAQGREPHPNLIRSHTQPLTQLLKIKEHCLATF